MRIANIADVHLGNHRIFGGELKSGLNKRAGLVMGTLEASYELAVKEECSVMVINGDLFDTSRPPPQHIAAVQALIQRYPTLQTVVLKGNHDMDSAEEGDHALGPLRPVAKIIEKPTKLVLKDHPKGRNAVDEVELWAVPFQPGEAAQWLPTVLAEVQGHPSTGSSASSARVLALHLGLQDGKTPPWLQGSHDSVKVELVQQLAQQFDLDAVYAGNWHNPEQWVTSLRIVQIGTLCPTGWDNPGLDFGTMAIFDSRSEQSCRHLPVPGPRFVSSYAGALKALDAGCKPFVRFKAAPDELTQVEESARALEQLGADVEIIPDTGEAQAALRTAAGVTRSAATVDEAVAAFVEQMPLEEPELRPFVLARVKGFLGGAT